MPDTDDVVGVTREQVLTVSGPSQGQTFSVLSLGGGSEFWFQFIDQFLLFQVEDLDGRRGGSNQPESVWRESQGVDFVTGVQGVQNLFVRQVPQDDRTVFTTGSDQRSIWGDGQGGDVTGVTDEVGVQRVVGQVPRLEQNVSMFKLGTEAPVRRLLKMAFETIRDLGDIFYVSFE